MIVTQKLWLVSEEGRKVTWQQIRKLSVINLVFFLQFCLRPTVNRHRICGTTTNRSKVQLNAMLVAIKRKCYVCNFTGRIWRYPNHTIEKKCWFNNVALTFQNKTWEKKLDRNGMLCASWYHLHNFKNMKNIHGGVSLLVKLEASALFHGCFSRFINCTNVTKSRKASNMHCKLKQ